MQSWDFAPLLTALCTSAWPLTLAALTQEIYILFWPLSKPDSGLSFSTKPTEASGEFLQATSTIEKEPRGTQLCQLQAFCFTACAEWTYLLYHPHKQSVGVHATFPEDVRVNKRAVLPHKEAPN